MPSGRFLSSIVLGLSLFAGVAGAARSNPMAPPHPVAERVVPMPVRALDRVAVRAALAARREVTIARFLAYREARVYPVNRDPGNRVRGAAPAPAHIWRDRDGHLCAAATIISADWGVEGTVLAAAGNNHLALAAVKTGPLADWMVTSGLTHHEVVAIQVPGFEMPEHVRPTAPIRRAEVERLHALYMDVERQLVDLGDESLDDATDALMRRPDLARSLLAGRLPAPPIPVESYPQTEPHRVPSAPPPHFAQPPPA